MFKLPEESTTKLIGKPESGMGYQIAEANVNGNRVTALVFNAELLVMFDELQQINGRAHEELLNEATMVESFELVKVVPAAAGAPPPPGSEPPHGASDVLAPAPQLLRSTVAHEGFVRFSAYVNEERVGSDGSLTKDTYATTIGDARFAVSGLAVAGRYALPNPSPAVYAYTIVPGVGVTYLAGTVRPANHQSGGGVEVLFSAGAPPSSVFKAYEIPEK